MRRPRRSAQRSISTCAARPIGVGDSALTAPARRPSLRSGTHSSATTDGTESRKSGLAATSVTVVTSPVRNVRPMTPAVGGMPS